MVTYEHRLRLSLKRTTRVDLATGKAPILLRIDIDNHPRVTLRTPVLATAAQWNAGRQRLQVQRGMSLDGEQQVIADNATLTCLLQLVERVYMVYRSQGDDPSPAQLRTLLRSARRPEQQLVSTPPPAVIRILPTWSIWVTPIPVAHCFENGRILPFRLPLVS